MYLLRFADADALSAYNVNFTSLTVERQKLYRRTAHVRNSRSFESFFSAAEGLRPGPRLHTLLASDNAAIRPLTAAESSIMYTIRITGHFVIHEQLERFSGGS